jgi:hypothetical protein
MRDSTCFKSDREVNFQLLMHGFVRNNFVKEDYGLACRRRHAQSVMYSLRGILKAVSAQVLDNTTCDSLSQRES